MCGLAGFLTTMRLRSEEQEAVLRRMIGTIAHRGPDDSGTWSDAEAGVGLGFRRLAILDLSELGHQPMRSRSGRYTMVFNGEVYNYQRLRQELELHGATFRGHSDSEVLLAAFEHWGIEAAVPRFLGMFGIAVWDGDRRSLSLIRDQLGIKPMYVYAQRGLVSFGSELKALRAGPAFDTTLDIDGLAAYLRYLYVPAPRTIYRHAQKLPPGHLLTIVDPAAPLPEPVPYWSPEDAARQGLAQPFTGSDEEATDELDRLLTDAVQLQMQSDVPLGALLSGGIDSSTVVSLMQASSPRPVETFSIGFDQEDYNEAAHAEGVARHLGTRHTGLMLTGQDALDVVPRLPEMFDEPFADPSQIPTFLVCQLARRRVTVALSGDGGDEVFAGYHRYMQGERLVEWMGRVPGPARRLVAAGIGSVSPTGWDRVAEVAAPLLPGHLRPRLPGEKLHKIRHLMSADSTSTRYRSLLSAWQDPERLVRGSSGDPGEVERILSGTQPAGLLERMMLADQMTYLPDDLLAKTDRASMAVSLEVRVPLLDHRVVEFGWRLPRTLKVRAGQGKWLLRQVLHRRVPKELVERPKMGFSVPIQHWLRGPLKVWAEDYLSKEALGKHEELNAAALHQAWVAFKAGQGNLALSLWALLMYLTWKQRWLTQSS
jgi:asparagine synthase (glutamine-hydrolysing)